jgi:hypothetical protein
VEAQAYGIVEIHDFKIGVQAERFSNAGDVSAPFAACFVLGNTFEKLRETGYVNAHHNRFGPGICRPIHVKRSRR